MSNVELFPFLYEREILMTVLLFRLLSTRWVGWNLFRDVSVKFTRVVFRISARNPKQSYEELLRSVRYGVFSFSLPFFFWVDVFLIDWSWNQSIARSRSWGVHIPSCVSSMCIVFFLMLTRMPQQDTSLQFVLWSKGPCVLGYLFTSWTVWND